MPVQKNLAYITTDIRRSITLVRGLEETGNYHINLVTSPSQPSDVHHFDIGRACASADLVIFDGLSYHLKFFSRINNDKPIVMKLFGPELLTGDMANFPWKRVKGVLMPSLCYASTTWKRFQDSILTNVRLLPVKIAATPKLPEIKLNLDSKRICMFHNFAYEYNLENLPEFLKLNPEFSVSIVGKGINHSYEDLILKKMDMLGVKRDRIEVYPELAEQVIEDFIADHPFVMSTRFDEVVFQQVREVMSFGSFPLILNTPISSMMFPSELLFDRLETFKVPTPTPALREIAKAALVSKEIETFNSLIKEVTE